mgnify:CR=1 FL=1
MFYLIQYNLTWKTKDGDLETNAYHIVLVYIIMNRIPMIRVW